MERPCILALIQSDLPLICELRAAWEDRGRGTLQVARNSQEAVLYLRGIGVYGDRRRFPLPDLAVLDCSNSSGSDLELLSWLRENPDFRELPVALLCPERHPMSEAICALDQCCYVVDRNRLDEVVRVGELAHAEQPAAPHAPWQHG